MFALLKETPDFAVSWLRYLLAMLRATNREVSEFNESLLVAAHIALEAAKENPLTLIETFELAGHNASMLRKGMVGAQEKLADFAFDQLEEGTRALINTVSHAEGEKLAGFMRREAEVMEAVANFTRADRKDQGRVRISL